MEYYVEVLFVYLTVQLRTFYGPFETPEIRDNCIDVVERIEQEAFAGYSELERRGELGEAGDFLGIIDPAHTKYIPHDGPLPVGEWVKGPLDIPDFNVPACCWYIDQEMQDFLVATTRNHG